MYQPYDPETAPTLDRIAWTLSEIHDANAPLNWTSYRSLARCIARSPDLMEDLRMLASEL
jgi:hypothetical protein